MPVGVAFTKDGDKAENPGLETETFAIRRNQTFTRKLRGSIKGCLNRKWRILRRGDDRRLPVHRSGRGKRQALDVIGPHRLQYVVSGNGILLEVLTRMFRAKTNICIGCQVKDKLTASHCIGKPR